MHMQHTTPHGSRAFRLAVAAVLAVWCGLLVGPPVAFLRWRDVRLPQLANPTTQADWDGFREAMRRESGREGPVQRKVPKSAEPPELVWLRDYAALAVTAWIAFVGILGGFLGLLVLGMLRAGLTGRGSASR
jgi:hypothetical protein